jgi:RNA polymerase sigma factor for flagellar operon FliA
MGTLDPSALASTWTNYKITGNPESRNQLILHYSSLVRYVAAKVGGSLPAMVDRDDLVSYGMFGLIDAIDKFDPDKGVKFETYGVTRIKGAIYDEIRALDWVPRSVRSKARDIEKARAEVEVVTGRPAEHAEIAEHLGLTMTEYWQLASQANAPSSVHDSIDFVGVSENTFNNGHEESAIRAIDFSSNPSELLESEEVMELVGEAVNNMDERSKTILVLYYLHGMTLAEIGKILGVTESRVCQLQSKVLQGLSNTLGQGGLAVA